MREYNLTILQEDKLKLALDSLNIHQLVSKIPSQKNSPVCVLKIKDFSLRDMISTSQRVNEPLKLENVNLSMLVDRIKNTTITTISEVVEELPILNNWEIINETIEFTKKVEDRYIRVGFFFKAYKSNEEDDLICIKIEHLIEK